MGKVKDKHKKLFELKDWKIPKRINIHDFTMLKKIICKSFLTNPDWFEYEGGYEVFTNMDNTIVGVS